MRSKISDPSATEAQHANPVFVIGLFRSGTSLLYSLLNQHPQIALMYECDVWNFPQLLSKARFRGRWLERLEFFNQSLSRHRLILRGSFSGLQNVQTADDLYCTFAEGKGATYWGEKSPSYTTRLRQLTARYPEARFILLWRDPAEVYRSVRFAALKSVFFGRRGMLHRVIYWQEQMIRQAGELIKTGARVHHTHYADLIAHPESVCRGLCEFLGIKFNPRMLDLANAELSAVYSAPHHDHLRAGVIERRQLPDQIVTPAAARILQRYQARWNRLSNAWQKREHATAGPPEPFWFERLYRRSLGSWLATGDTLKRVIFEFLPLPWLRVYRQLKAWYCGPRTLQSEGRLSTRVQFRQHWITIVLAWGVMIGAAIAHYHWPQIQLLPFYALPCATLTLVVSRRWGTGAAFVAAIIAPIMQGLRDPAYAATGILVWNIFARFIFLQSTVILLHRVRIETETIEAATH